MATNVNVSTVYAAGSSTTDGLNLTADDVSVTCANGLHTLNYPSDNTGINVDDRTGCTIQGFEIADFTRRGIDCFETSADGTTNTGHVFDRNYIHGILSDTGNAPTGIWASGAHIKITNNVIENIYDDGIFLRGQNCIVSGNYIAKCSQNGSTNGDSIQLSGAVDNTVVRSNYCDHSDVSQVG